MRKLLTLLFAFLSSVVFSQEADTTGIKKDSVPATPWVLYHAIEARLAAFRSEHKQDMRPVEVVIQEALQALADGKTSGLSAQREAEILAAWKAKQATSK